eukprot:s2051_g6.t1
MSSRAQTSYLTTDLSLPEDETLGFQSTHWNIGNISKPPGIHTLEEWGQLRAPSGKYPGQTFEEIFQKDQVYVHHMWNRRGVSTWVRSFQMYCRAVRKFEPTPDHHRMQQAPVAPKTMSRPKSMPQQSSQQSSSPPSSLSEWIPVGSTSPRLKNENKRSMAESKSSAEMKVEPNQDRVEVLRTQIAIMQRELQKEMGNSSGSGSQAHEDQ